MFRKHKKTVILPLEEETETPLQEARDWLTRHDLLRVAVDGAPQYFKKLIHVILQETADPPSCHHLYDLLRTREDMLGECAPFHLWPFIGHIPQHLWMSHAPLEIHISWLREADFSSASIASFCKKYELWAMERLMLQDPVTEPEIQKLWTWLAEQPNTPNACRYLGSKDFLLMKERMNKIPWMNFDKILHHYEYPHRKRMKMVDPFGCTISIPTTTARHICDSNSIQKKIRYFTPERKIPILSSVFRPWIPWEFHTMLIQPVENSSSSSLYTGKQLRKGWFEPTMFFHEAYLAGGGGSQKSNIYECLVTKERFRIAYGMTASSWRLQNETLFAREKRWSSQSRLVVTIDSLRKHLRKRHVSVIHGNFLARSLSPPLSFSIVENMINASGEDEKVVDLLSRLYHVYGRLSTREPLAAYHTSLLFKIKHLLHQDARLFSTPQGLLFPEYYFYDKEDRDSLDEAWATALEIFIDKTLIMMMGRESGFSLIADRKIRRLPLMPVVRPPTVATGFLVYSHASEEHLTVTPDILDLLEEEDIAYINEEAIRRSMETTKDTPVLLVTTTEDPKEKPYISIQDMEAFLLDLEQGKEVAKPSSPIGEDEDSDEEEDAKDEDSDEEEVDIEEFYTGGL